ncbi:hypothetical protein ACJZ2D_004039 [Fusarium nematophilum]
MTSHFEARPSSQARLTLEAWSQGFMIGALIIMVGITLSNMRRGVLLHKLILVELLLAIPNGFFTFFEPPVWGWYLSSTAIVLIASWTLHNIVAWIKNKPFLNKRGNLIYIGTIILVQPYWVLELYANFAYFNDNNDTLFTSTRPLEAVCRDPWWIFTTANLFWNIKYRYELSLIEIVRVSPRFGLLLLSMSLSIVFITVDLLSVTPALAIGVINPFWKFAFVFKCFTDTIILDDFKTALDKLSQHRMNQIHQLPFSNPSTDLQAPGAEMPRRRDAASCDGNSLWGSVEQVERVSADLSNMSTTEAGPRPPPVVLMKGTSVKID